MRVVVTGGTGFVGRALCRALRARGDAVVVLSRGSNAGAGPDVVAWTGRSDGEWARSIDGADAVVNLAGASIAGRRWSAAYREEIRRSRVEATQSLVDAIGRASAPPRVLVSGSAVGYYGPTGDEALGEASPAGNDFLARVCAEWEGAALGAQAHRVRVVRLRTGLVLGPGGGSLAEMARPFRFFVGGRVGNGRQWMSWIHLDDEVGLLLHALSADDVHGPLNAAAPGAVRNSDFARTLGRVLGRPSWFPVPGLALRVVVGDVAEIITTGQRVVPAAALASGYSFRYPELEPALRASL